MHCFDPLYVKRNKNDKTTVTTTSLRDQNLARYLKNPSISKNEINVTLKEASSSKWNSRMYEDNVKFNNNIIKRDAQAQNIIKSEI